MQKHMQMMKAMMEGKGMDHAKMKEMMGDDSSMMKMHMMCMQMMQEGMKSDMNDMKEGDHKHNH